MPQKDDEINLGHFVLGIRAFQNKETGIVTHRIDWQNKNISLEVVMSNLRIFLRKLEDDAYDQFRGSSVEYRQNDDDSQD